MQVALKRCIDAGAHGQREQEQHESAKHGAADLRQGRRQRHGHEAGKRFDVALEVHRTDGSQHQRQRTCLERVDELLLGDESGQAGDRVELVELRHQGLERPVPAADEYARGNGDQGHHHAQGNHHPHELRGHGRQVLRHEFGVGAGGAIEAQGVGKHLLQPGRELRRRGHHERAAGGDGREVPQVARTRNLALFTRFLKFALRGR